MAKVAHLGPLAAILVSILQDLSMGSTKNVPLNELFQLSQSWGGGGGGPTTDRQTTGPHRRVTCRVLLASSKARLKKKSSFFPCTGWEWKRQSFWKKISEPWPLWVDSTSANCFVFLSTCCGALCFRINNRKHLYRGLFSNEVGNRLPPKNQNRQLFPFTTSFLVSVFPCLVGDYRLVTLSMSVDISHFLRRLSAAVGWAVARMSVLIPWERFSYFWKEAWKVAGKWENRIFVSFAMGVDPFPQATVLFTSGSQE